VKSESRENKEKSRKSEVKHRKVKEGQPKKSRIRVQSTTVKSRESDKVKESTTGK
jgi:hypothetical protein